MEMKPIQPNDRPETTGTRPDIKTRLILLSDDNILLRTENKGDSKYCLFQQCVEHFNRDREHIE